MAEAVKRTPGLELLQGKFVFDVKPAGITKGTAIQALLDQPPFKGRVPLFAGDDVTDEAGFATVQTLGGDNIKIGAGASLAHYRCPDPETFRQWLASSAKVLQA
jgi:trehalose 6-phosphate phosphatase